MQRPEQIGSAESPKAEKQARSGALRDALALLLALVTIVCLGSVFVRSKGTMFLMPGPLASAHGAVEKCDACHTKSGSGKLSWVHGLVAGDPLADSKACLTCHKMPDTAFNAHSASTDILKQSTARLTKIAADSPVPQSLRAQSIAFPTHNVVARGLFCATCHQEHQGVDFNLNKISNEKCSSCHVVKLDSFDGHHPKFENYPFKRRTQIVYDHAGHFGKHFPEVAKKDPAKRIPATCSTCHNSHDDRRIMTVAPFEKTCSACHLDQITGKERVSGPKGIAFLTLPGLDLQTLKTKKASIGEWPDASEAALTPFMKVMISRHERGRALIKTVDRLNLQDLSDASVEQITAVTNLVWEIKGLVYALISGKASDVLGDLNIGGGAKLSANLVADLTASIPRDVVISAQQQWLPNLAREMANRPGTGGQKQSSRSVSNTDSESDGSASQNESSLSNARRTAPRARQQAADSEAPLPEKSEHEQSASSAATTEPTDSATADETSGPDAPEATSTNNSQAAISEGASNANRDPQACLMRVLGQCLLFKDSGEEPEAAAGPTDTANAKPDGRRQARPSGKLPEAMRAGIMDAGQAVKDKRSARSTDTAEVKPAAGKKTLSAVKLAQGKSTDQSDDLLFPTKEELREIGGLGKDAEKAARAAPPADTPKEAASLQTTVAPVISIDSDVDPETWAEYGGWYRQDYGIFYRPAGHKDKFIYSWLFLTGPQAPKGDTSPAAAVFDFLTNKDAQGSCTKCHSVDEGQGKRRIVNFSPLSVEGKQGRFTNFIHEPHFGIMENRGCLTCHKLEKDRPYLKSYEQGNPQNFVSNFGSVNKDLCETCHTTSKARQDCLLCHKYHVNGVITPIMNTRLPTQ